MDDERKNELELARKYANADDYDEPRFWRTVGRQAAKWGSGLLLQVLTLYYCMVDPKTPAKSKAVIAGALAYTILPTDLIPDFLPAVGWGDDAAMIAWAGFEVLKSIDETHREKARQKARSLLGTGPSPN
ncbi:MAG TPA: YkvA family protein [Trueperaceae bacterium]